LEQMEDAPEYSEGKQLTPEMVRDYLREKK
jgi:hypothetical protein